MKKILCVLLVFSLMIVGVTGCSPKGNETSNGASPENEVFVMRIAHTMQEDNPLHKGMVAFADYVNEKGDGRIRATVFPNSSLGNERQTAEACQLGSLEVGVVMSAVLANFEPSLTVFELPFLFKNLSIARQAVDGELGQAATEGLSNVNLKSLTLVENGFRMVTNNQRPLHSPQDLKGIKIRTMENPVHVKTFKCFGATPTPMAFSELYTALQQGTVDAQENPITHIYTSRFCEVQKYLTLTGHVYGVGSVVIGLDFWNSLPEDLQKVVMEGADQGKEVQRQLNDELTDKYIKELEKVMTVNALTDEEKQVFIDATEIVYDDVAEIVGQELVDLAVLANETYE